MSLPPTYSRRKRQAEAKSDDVYVYDQIPKKVRVQVVQILREGLGPYYVRGDYSRTADIYDHIYKKMYRELGVHTLPPNETDDKAISFFSWLEFEKDIDNWLDGVELALTCINRFVRKRLDLDHRVNVDEVISELNARLREAAIGYEFSGAMIVRKDSELIHREVVIPTLKLLNDPRFAAAEKEFRDAHEAYRHSRLEDSIVNCGKALESVLKVIGGSRGWPITENDPASKLIQAAVGAGFLASYS